MKDHLSQDRSGRHVVQTKFSVRRNNMYKGYEIERAYSV